MASENLNTPKLLKKFFLNYTWAGFTFMLFAIIIDLDNPSATRKEYLVVMIKLFEGVGVAILVASIFSFASGTTTFMKKIQELLEKIVVSRTFLSNIALNEKREALKSLIQPSISEKNVYPNIGDYYGNYIDKTLSVSKKNVRSKYAVFSQAKYDNGSSKVFVASTFTYRLFPGVEGYNDITIGFRGPKNGDSVCDLIRVSDSNNNEIRKTGDELEFFETTINGDTVSKANVKLNNDFKESNHVDVEIHIREYGSDHWHLLDFTALQPTDGFTFMLYCDDQTILKEHVIFMVGSQYRLDISDDKKKMSLSCTCWIDEGSGLCVVIAKQ